MSAADVYGLDPYKVELIIASNPATSRSATGRQRCSLGELGRIRIARVGECEGLLAYADRARAGIESAIITLTAQEQSR